MTAALTGTHLNYLAAIHEISRSGRVVSSAEVARALNVSRPSVTRMLVVMSEKGMTVKERYGKIELTEEGVRIAEAVLRMSRSVEQLLSTELSLTPTEAQAAARAVATSLPQRILMDA